MMFVDDVVICCNSRVKVEENLEKLGFAPERRRMKESATQSCLLKMLLGGRGDRGRSQRRYIDVEKETEELLG